MRGLTKEERAVLGFHTRYSDDVETPDDWMDTTYNLVDRGLISETIVREWIDEDGDVCDEVVFRPTDLGRLALRCCTVTGSGR